MRLMPCVASQLAVMHVLAPNLLALVTVDAGHCADLSRSYMINRRPKAIMAWSTHWVRSLYDLPDCTAGAVEGRVPELRIEDNCRAYSGSASPAEM